MDSSGPNADLMLQCLQVEGVKFDIVVDLVLGKASLGTLLPFWKSDGSLLHIEILFDYTVTLRN